jgi:hypothetical protein
LLAGLSIEDGESNRKYTLDFSRPGFETADSSDVEDDGLDEDDHITHALFDLEALDESHARSPVFTGTLLERIASDVTRISSEYCKPVSERKLGALHWTSHDGQSFRIWKDVPNANHIAVNYMTRIEMSSQFHGRSGKNWARTMVFRAMNASMQQEELDNMAALKHLTSARKLPNTLHHDAQEMELWRAKLSNTQELWEDSASCNQLCDIVRSGASKLKAQIAKIICVGLGKLNTDPAFYQSAAQHMTIFSFAKTLDAYNRTQYPDCPPITIIAQDLCYE